MLVNTKLSNISNWVVREMLGNKLPNGAKDKKNAGDWNEPSAVTKHSRAQGSLFFSRRLIDLGQGGSGDTWLD